MAFAFVNWHLCGVAGTATGWFENALSPCLCLWLSWLFFSRAKNRKVLSLLKARPGSGTLLLLVHSSRGKLGGEPRLKGKTGHLLMGRAVCTYREGKNQWQPTQQIIHYTKFAMFFFSCLCLWLPCSLLSINILFPLKYAPSFKVQSKFHYLLEKADHIICQANWGTFQRKRPLKGQQA